MIMQHTCFTRSLTSGRVSTIYAFSPFPPHLSWWSSEKHSFSVCVSGECSLVHRNNPATPPSTYICMHKYAQWTGSPLCLLNTGHRTSQSCFCFLLLWPLDAMRMQNVDARNPFRSRTAAAAVEAAANAKHLFARCLRCCDLRCAMLLRKHKKHLRGLTAQTESWHYSIMVGTNVRSFTLAVR